MTLREFYDLDPSRKQQLFDTVRNAFDRPLEDYEQFQEFVKYVAVKPSENEKLYKTRSTGKTGKW